MNRPWKLLVTIARSEPGIRRSEGRNGQEPVNLKVAAAREKIG